MCREVKEVHRMRKLYLLFLLLLLSCSVQPARAQSQNWWTVNSERDLPEKGKLKELLTKKRVYVNVSYTDTRPNPSSSNSEQNNMSRAVNQAISAQKDLQKVTFPEEAEFADRKSVV